jgi:hypothetical protein
MGGGAVSYQLSAISLREEVPYHHLFGISSLLPKLIADS